MTHGHKNSRAAAQKWAIKQDLSQTEKSVLMALARRYSPRWGRCEVTQKQVSDELGIRRETANRTLAALEKKRIIASGFLERKSGQWDRKFYILNGFQRGFS